MSLGAGVGRTRGRVDGLVLLTLEKPLGPQEASAWRSLSLSFLYIYIRWGKGANKYTIIQITLIAYITFEL